MDDRFKWPGIFGAIWLFLLMATLAYGMTSTILPYAVALLIGLFFLICTGLIVAIMKGR